MGVQELFQGLFLLLDGVAGLFVCCVAAEALSLWSAAFVGELWVYLLLLSVDGLVARQREDVLVCFYLDILSIDR